FPSPETEARQREEPSENFSKRSYSRVIEAPRTLRVLRKPNAIHVRLDCQIHRFNGEDRICGELRVKRSHSVLVENSLLRCPVQPNRRGFYAESFPLVH